MARAKTVWMFIEPIKRQFSFLTSSYHFLVVEELCAPEAFGNSLVRYRSANVEITVVLDRGQVQVDIASIPNVSNYRFALPTLVEYLAPESGETDYVYPDELTDYYDKIDWQINRLATLLEQYGRPIFRGEFSAWHEVNERRQRQALLEYRKLTGKEPLNIESKQFGEKLHQEINRRVEQQNRSPDPAATQKQEGDAPPWWAFWRRR